MAFKEMINLLFMINLILVLGSCIAYSKSLPKAHQSPLNVDPALDCAINELALEFARKLQPQRGSLSVCRPSSLAAVTLVGTCSQQNNDCQHS